MILGTGQSDHWIVENLPLEKFLSSGMGLVDYKKLIKNSILKVKLKTRVITIAGTNGKGEVCQRMAYLLKKYQPEKSFALWTSPHLFTVRERFVQNGNLIDDESLLSLLKENRAYAKELSYYEFLFFIFCHWIDSLKIDYLILEVGLGGRLDSVNCFDADLMGITSIGRDHTEFLGEELHQILDEKLGISRANRPLYSTVVQPELRQRLKERASSKPFDLVDLVDQNDFPQKSHYQQMNAYLALSLFEALTKIKRSEVDWSDYRATLGRGEVLLTKWGEFLPFGTHNADGLMALDQLLGQRVVENYDGIFVGLTKRPTRDLCQCIKILYESFKKRSLEFKILDFEHPKAIGNKTLLAELERGNSPLKDDVEKDICDFDSWWELFEKKDHQEARYLLTGSNYFIAEFISALDRHNIIRDSRTEFR